MHTMSVCYLFFQAHHCEAEKTIQLFGLQGESLVYLLLADKTAKSPACLNYPMAVMHSTDKIYIYHFTEITNSGNSTSVSLLVY